MGSIILSFFVGGILGTGFMVWHYSKVHSATVAEGRVWQREIHMYQDKANRLGGDLKFAESVAVSLRAQRDLTAEYNRGYDDGFKYAKNLNETEKFAYTVNNGESARMSRLVDFQGNKTVTAHGR